MIGQAVAQLLGDEVAELLFHRVHQGDFERNVGSGSHSAEFGHVVVELFILAVQRAQKRVHESQ